KEEFEALAAELRPLDIVSNLDTGELARYCVAHSLYQRYTKLLRQAPKKKAARMRREAEEKGEPISEDVSDEELSLDMEETLVRLQCKYFEQCETTARALGLNITSRCRLVIPKAAEPTRENKFARFDRQTG
ncbi:MAG: phage terminase small subunit P27 family, partial [Oscillospiraceae bacterium]